MNTRKFKINNYITVPGFAVVELGLSGNELLCYSLIHGFTQDGDSEFNGSLHYISTALNVTRQNAKKIIDRLVARGLVEKREIYYSGVKFCHYLAIVPNNNGVTEIATECCRNSNGGVAEIATNDINKEDNITDIDKENANALFPPATIEAITPEGEKERKVAQKERKTAEPLCLFENSRYNDIELFKASFDGPEFADVDLDYYFHSVADWSSSKGAKKRDWIATARNFMRGDMEKGKLHRKPQTGIEGMMDPDEIAYLKMGWDGFGK